MDYLGIVISPLHLKIKKRLYSLAPTEHFTYRHTPFGLCNAPATFQRYMMAIFDDKNYYNGIQDNREHTIESKLR